MENELTNDLYERIFQLEEEKRKLEEENQQLKWDVEHLTEEIEKIENDLEHNYKRIPDDELYDVSDKDFI